MSKHLLAIIKEEDFNRNPFLDSFMADVKSCECNLLFNSRGYALNNSPIPSFNPKDRRHFLLFESPNDFDPDPEYFRQVQKAGYDARLLEISQLKLATIFSAKKTRKTIGGEVMQSSFYPVKESLSLYEETRKAAAKDVLVQQIEKGLLSGIAFTYRTLFKGRTKLKPTYVSWSLMTQDDKYAIAFRGKIGPYSGTFPDKIKIGF